MKLQIKKYKFELRGFMNDEIICPVCGIKKINGNFYFDFTLKTSNPQPSTPDSVYSRVCQYAKQDGCINSIANLDEKLTINNTLPEWESVTKHYIKNISDNP